MQIEKRHAGVNYHQQHARSVDQARSVINGSTRALLVAVVLAAAYWFWAYAR
jgi:ABC-type sulfate transport system substrate-binding protein